MPLQHTNASLDRVELNAWFDVRRREVGQDVVAQLAQKDVVLLGEGHDNAEHHRWALNTLNDLLAIRLNMAIGFEMFPRRVQGTLDRWCRGDLNEADFFRGVAWEQIGGCDATVSH